MKYIYLVINWILGLFFIILSVASFFQSFWVGLIFLSISFFFIPPVRSFIHSKSNKKLPVKIKVITIFGLLMVSFTMISQLQTEKKQELDAQKVLDKNDEIVKVQQENITYFNNNRENIINSIKKELSNEKYDVVLSLSEKYLKTGDAELNNLNLLASSKLNQLKKDEKIQLLLGEAEKLSGSDLSKNNDIYKELMILNPDNALYKKKVDFYTEKIKQEEEKRLIVEARKDKIKDQFSPWDGSHINLERVLKKAMNDPDSYEHEETLYWDKGDYLIVQITYRGRNAFGALVKNFVKAKVSLDGQILQILDQS